MGKLLKPQPSLVHVPVEKDVVYTPRWLARAIIDHFQPTGLCLDPCMGDGAFYDQLPHPRLWAEIEEGADFFAWSTPVDWAIGNPPYSCLLAWLRYSFMVANDIVYLMPVHRVVASYQFLQELNRWGGIKEIVVIGTGHHVGFPFGHCLGAVHYSKGWNGDQKWTHVDWAKEASL